MSAQITKIPNRDELVEEQARLYLRGFDAKKYSTYYARIFDAEAYLDQVGIDTICEMMEHGHSLLDIAKQLDISSRTLRAWVNKAPYRVAQVKLAYNYAGEAFAFKAEHVLRNSGASKAEITLASKLAEHYRWMASRLDREKFGDAVKADDNKTRPPMNITLNFGGAEAPKEQLVKSTPLIADFMRLNNEDE